MRRVPSCTSALISADLRILKWLDVVGCGWPGPVTIRLLSPSGPAKNVVTWGECGMMKLPNSAGNVFDTLEPTSLNVDSFDVAASGKNGPTIPIQLLFGDVWGHRVCQILALLMAHSPSIKYLQTSKCPALAAAMRGVTPMSGSGMFKSALAFESLALLMTRSKAAPDFSVR